MAATLLTTALVLDLTPTDPDPMMDALHAYRAIFSPLFARREQRERASTHLQGLLPDILRTSIEPVMPHLRGADRGSVRTLQQFVSIDARGDGPILVQLRREVAVDLGDDDGVLVVNSSDFPNQGTDPSGWSDSILWPAGQDGRLSRRGLFGLRHRTGLRMLSLAMVQQGAGRQTAFPLGRGRKLRTAHPADEARPSNGVAVWPQACARRRLAGVHDQGEFQGGLVVECAFQRVVAM